MCKAALIVLAVNMIANSAVFQVVKEQIQGGSFVDDSEKETGFID